LSRFEKTSSHAALQYALGGLVVLVGMVLSCRVAAMPQYGGGGLIALTMGLMLAYAVLAFLGATWLRRAARHFYEGVMLDHESPLARGFRNLRLYLILYGIFW